MGNIFSGRRERWDNFLAKISAIMSYRVFSEKTEFRIIAATDLGIGIACTVGALAKIIQIVQSYGDKSHVLVFFT
jgi:Na+/glutamate symporter